MAPLVAVTFVPSGAVARVEPGTTVLEAARSAGVVIPAACGSRGVCGSCAVKVVEGSLGPADEAERAALSRCGQGVRLACRAVAESDVTIRPLFSASPSAAAESSRPAPSETGRPDELVAGVDLGTTTVAVRVLTAAGGTEIGFATVPNAQASWGADVLSRVAAAQAGASGALQAAAVESIEEALAIAIGHRGALRLSRVVVAGNSAMSGLLTGSDVSTLAAHPFTAPTLASETGGGLSERLNLAAVSVLPPIKSFVGGDITAGLVHTGMLWSAAPELLVDLGTNAEIALVRGDRLWVASAAAGPAFEGVGIEFGVSAQDGAITSVALTDEGTIELVTIGGADPVGLTGSGLISAVALLLRLGHVDAEGLLVHEGPFESRFYRGEDGVLRVRLHDDSEVSVSQLDVRALQLAKAAVQVGVRRVLEAAGVSAAELAHVHVAGAFGGALSPDDLVLLGVLPRGTRSVIASAGNASLAGAAVLALEPDLIAEAATRASAAVHVKLANAAGFNEQLIDALSLQAYDC